MGVVRSPALNRVWLPTALKSHPYRKEVKMSNYKHTFVPGYSKKKRNELESTGRLTPKHALSSEYLLRLLDKICYVPVVVGHGVQ